MKRHVLIETDRVEIFHTASGYLIFLLMMEVVLGIGIYFFVVKVEGGRWFAAALGFFFIALATAVLPAINNLKNGGRILVWAVTRTGIELPSGRSNWSKLRPPTSIDWAVVDRLVIVDKLKFPSEDGKATTWNVLVLFYRPSEHTMAETKSRWRRLDLDGFRIGYKILSVPKKHKQEIIEQLKMLVPDGVKVRAESNLEID